MQKKLLVDLDRQHLIHPVTNPRAHEKRGVNILASGKGAWLKDIDGRELLDAFSGLWCVNVGYGQESVVRAATEQMRKLAYATGYFDFGSEPAIRLAAKLVEIAPRSLRHVYFTLGGSDAVDSAIRLITNYFNSIGKPQKKQFISIQRGYHGSSSMGAGLTAIPPFHANFDLPLPTQHRIPSPYPYRNPAGDNPRAVIDASGNALREKGAEVGPEHVPASFSAPAQGSGGGLLGHGQAQAAGFGAGLRKVLDRPLVGGARSRGLLGALELVSDKATKRGFDPALGLSDRISDIAYRNGLVFRCFGDNILGFAPALCYGEREFDLMFERLGKILDEVLEIRDVRKALAADFVLSRA